MKVSQLIFSSFLNSIKNKFFFIVLLFVISVQSTTAAEISSGGLGLSKQAWEAKQGKPDTKCPSNLPYTCYSGGKYMVSYMENYIWVLEIYIYPLPYTSKTTGISIEESRSLSKKFIPIDGRFIKTYKNRSGSTVDLYISESLRSLESCPLHTS